MKSVYVPGHVVLLLRRLVNAFSTFSISNHYLVQYRAGHHEERPSRHPAATTRDWEWWAQRDRWKWLQDVGLEELRASRAERATSTSLPWIRSNRWPWHSLLSLSHDLESNKHPYSQDPPPTHPATPSQRRHYDPPRPNPPLPDLPPTTVEDPPSLDIIHQLLQNPALYDPVRTPRYPIALCHGLYGFDSRGPASFPSLRMQYWANVLNILRNKVGAEVIVTSVPGTGSIQLRSQRMHDQLQFKARGRGINFLAHSMGGLDCRQLITHVQPNEYVPLSLTTIATPHRGSPFMDWCAENIGLGKIGASTPVPHPENEGNKISSSRADVKSMGQSSPEPPPSSNSFTHTLSSLPSSFTTLLLSIVDSPAYANLTSAYLNDVFNPSTPDDPRVKYFSVAGRTDGLSVWHPLWLPKLVLDGWEEKQRMKEKKDWEELAKTFGSSAAGKRPRWAKESEWGNDGLVTVQSAKWGTFWGTMENCDHWEMRGARGIEFGVDLPPLPTFGISSAPSTSTDPNKNESDGWSFKEWGKFVGAWRKEEQRFKSDAADRPSMTPSTVGMSAVIAVEMSNAPPMASGPTSPPPQPASLSSVETKGRARQLDRDRDLERDDAVVRSSTDKLSTVFDWLMQLPVGVVGVGGFGSVNGSSAAAKRGVEGGSASLKPSPGPVSSPTTGPPPQKRRVGGLGREAERRRKNELASKEDLERFYVALSRKLYDEGL